MKPRVGKCTNYSGCKLAYRNEKIAVLTKEFKCPECGSPLEAMTTLRKSSGSGWMVFGVVAVLLLAVTSIFWSRWFAMKTLPYSEVVPAATPVATPIPTPEPTPVTVFVPTPPPTPIPTPVPPSPTPNPLALGLTADELERVKSEVIKRIELMPDLTAKKRQILYTSLARARGMKLLATVSFKTAQNRVSPADSLTIKTNFSQPAVQVALDDPTTVFVILGYASKQGNDKTNFQLSQMRADTVMNLLQQQFQIKNVIYPVPMGSSSLFGNGNPVDNQVAEIWIVVP